MQSEDECISLVSARWRNRSSFVLTSFLEGIAVERAEGWDAVDPFRPSRRVESYRDVWGQAMQGRAGGIGT